MYRSFASCTCVVISLLFEAAAAISYFQFCNFRCCQKICSRAVDFPTVRIEVSSRVEPDRLGPADHAVGVNKRVQGRPRLLYHRQILLAVQDLIVDAPRQRVGMKTRTATLASRIRIGVEKASSPKAIRLLQ